MGGWDVVDKLQRRCKDLEHVIIKKELKIVALKRELRNAKPSTGLVATKARLLAEEEACASRGRSSLANLIASLEADLP